MPCLGKGPEEVAGSLLTNVRSGKVPCYTDLNLLIGEYNGERAQAGASHAEIPHNEKGLLAALQRIIERSKRQAGTLMTRPSSLVQTARLTEASASAWTEVVRKGKGQGKGKGHLGKGKVVLLPLPRGLLA